MISANFPGFYETMISKRLLKDYYLKEKINTCNRDWCTKSSPLKLYNRRNKQIRKDPYSKDWRKVAHEKSQVR